MTLIAWLVVASAVVTALGWIKQTWFFSVGYACSVIAMVGITGVVARDHLTPLAVIQLLLLALWGVRLAIFLVTRERAASYAKRPEADRATMSAPVRLAIWIMCLLLYPAMITPAVLAAQASGPTGVWTVISVVGLAILASGVAVEALADRQKQRAKSVDPARFVATGLYSWVRVPNYLGEIMVWLGSLLAGAYALTTPLRWVVALLGFGCLVFIMLGATRRLERTQTERYGDESAFQTYVSTVPVLVPWVPLYSIRRLPVPEL